MNHSVRILGALDGIDTGIRNLIRSAPLETEHLVVNGVTLTVPTVAECLRIKTWLALTRNATRDYLDVAALAQQLGPGEAVAALTSMDDLYPQSTAGAENGWIVRTQLIKQFRDPRPYDLDEVDLAEYKGVRPPFDSWQAVATACHSLALNALAAFRPMLQEDPSRGGSAALADLDSWSHAIAREEAPPVPPLPGVRPQRKSNDQ